MFDPNEVNIKNNKKNYTWEYATYIFSRTPKFKIHGNRGQCVTAIKYHGYSSDWPNDDKLRPYGEIHAYVKDKESGKWVELKLKDRIKEGEIPWESDANPNY